MWGALASSCWLIDWLIDLRETASQALPSWFFEPTKLSLCEPVVFVNKLEFSFQKCLNTDAILYLCVWAESTAWKCRLGTSTCTDYFYCTSEVEVSLWNQLLFQWNVCILFDEKVDKRVQYTGWAKKPDCFLPRDAMLARYWCLSVCPSVCPSVCLSHVGVVQRWLNLGLH